MVKMKRGLLLVGLFLALFSLFPFPGSAQVRVDVRIVPPPPYRFHSPPPVVVIPGTYVYMIPGINVDIVFFSGYWYRPYGSHWFRAQSYRGPWVCCPDPRVPRAVRGLPPGYRRVPPGHRRIPYGQFKKSWRAWERDRYWDRDPEWRKGGPGRPGEGRVQGGPPGKPGPGYGHDEHRGRGDHGGHGHGGR